MPINPFYDTATLVALVKNLKVPPMMVLDRFFPGSVMFDGETVAIDIEQGKRRMAPFVHPQVAGKVVEGPGFETMTYKAPYIKDKRVLNPKKPLTRMQGEQLLGAMTPAEREEANLVLQLEDQLNMLRRRQTWMAYQALVAGKVLVKGEGFAPALIDFRRSAQLTAALTGSATWGSANVNPTDTVEMFSAAVLQESGAPVTDLLHTQTSWRLFRKDQEIRDAIVANAPGVTVDFGGGVGNGIQYKGMWGAYRLWLVSDWFHDDDTNTELPMIPDGGMVLVSDQMDGRVGFATLQDPDLNYEPLEYGPKSWTEKDPAQRFLMMQSAPIVIPFRVNAAAYVQVAPAGTGGGTGPAL